MSVAVLQLSHDYKLSAVAYENRLGSGAVIKSGDDGILLVVTP